MRTTNFPLDVREAFASHGMSLHAAYVVYTTLCVTVSISYRAVKCANVVGILRNVAGHVHLLLLCVWTVHCCVCARTIAVAVLSVRGGLRCCFLSVR